MTTDVRQAVETATNDSAAGTGARPARFSIPVPENQDPIAVRQTIIAALAPLETDVKPISASAPHDLVLILPRRIFTASEEARFAAAHALEETLGISPIEPEVIHSVMPVEHSRGDQGLESADNFPGCWVSDEDAIKNDKAWALARLRIREAWQYSESQGRPSRGEGIVIAQIDTGVTDHPELEGVVRAASYNILGDGKTPEDPTDPLNYLGNDGHGTGTASVVVSPESLEVVGAAPKAKHLPIRAIENVVRLSQTDVAAAIDRAVELGAHIISMSLGGIWSYTLERALDRAIASDVIVVAAVGNCVKLVVWPARFDDCIAVAGTDYHDKPWIGTCRGSSVTISAPAQNVYRAAAGTTTSGQGQGTSFATPLIAGIAACWLAHHGRSTIAAEARKRNETIQSLFRRLLKTTARRPSPDWNVFSMGAGIADAGALLKADFDAGRETESPVEVASREDGSLRDLAVEALGKEAVKAPVDWKKYGVETSLAIFKQRKALHAQRAQGAASLESTGGGAVPGFPRAVADALQASRTGAAPSPIPAPRIVRAPSPPDSQRAKRIQQLRRGIIARQQYEESAGLESAGGDLESSVPADASAPHPDTVLDRISRVMKAMPPREIGDPAAFRQALTTLYAQGSSALGKLGDLDRGPDHDLNSDEQGSLEAIIIADGTRPSFLLDNGLLPEDHPFFGVWKDQILDRRKALQPLANAVGRVQPEGGHASNFIGTATVVDASKGYALTNYHVVDSARSDFGISMIQNGNSLQIPSGLEVDFIGEASSFNQNRFKVVEAILPTGYGRGFGNVDAALLKLEPLPGAALPAAVTLTANPAEAMGGVLSLIAIGFPGPARRLPGDKVDWAFVTNTLFGNLFGFKRLAPGKFSRALGYSGDDKIKSVFGHDATTFGGSSGSFIIDWNLAGMPSFGLHFYGITKETNSAIAIACVADALRQIGVPIAQEQQRNA